MTDPATKRNSTGFQPVPPSPTALERLVWAFSLTGRAKLKLRRAYHNPTDPRVRDSVVKVLDKLRSLTPLGEAAESALKDILVFLVWSSLRQNATDEAVRWMAALESELPGAQERTSLRWDLMCRLLSGQNFGAYLTQARSFVADPAAERTEFEIPLRVARILAGAPKSPDRDDRGALAAIESAMLLLLTSGYDTDPTVVRGRLSEAHEDSICEEFPALRSAAEVLGFALDAFSETKSSQDLRVPRVRGFSWMSWTLVRAYLKLAGAAIAAGPERVPFLTSQPASEIDVATAWAVESWWSMYGPPDVETPVLIQICVNRLESVAGEASEECAKAISSVRQARAKGSKAQPVDAASLSCLSSIWGIGDLYESVISDELRYEAALLNLRIDGGPGDSQSTRESSARAYGELVELLDGMPPISSAWFRPAVVYRQAAALTQVDPDGARTLLGSLRPSPKGPEARAQLALLDIQAADLDKAEQHLKDLRGLYPSVLYAHALLHVRRGNVDPARQLMASFDTAFRSTESPYRLAVKRLQAALEERSGNMEEAEKLHREVLGMNPSDSTTAARLSRLILKKTYGTPMQGEAAASQELALLLQTAGSGPARQLDWSKGHDLLRRLLVCPEDELTGMREEALAAATTPAGRLALLQVAVRRLLEKERTDGALKMIEIDGPSTDYAAHHRARLVLRAWRHLADLWSPFKAPSQDAVEAQVKRARSEGKGASPEPDEWANAEAALRAKAAAASISREALKEVAACAEEMAKLRSDDGDEVVQRWRFLLTQALALGRASDAEIKPNLWQELKPWPFAFVPELWASDPAVRAQAAVELQPAFDTEGVNWNEQQKLLMNGLMALASGREEEYLDSYALLEPMLDRLPVDAQSLWLKTGGIWFRRGNWRQLLESELPECVADLSNPEVRLLIAFAYARAAAEDGQKDPRKALQKVRQARGTMEPLLTTVGE